MNGAMNFEIGLVRDALEPAAEVSGAAAGTAVRVRRVPESVVMDLVGETSPAVFTTAGTVG
jgi:hypothetical protein